MKKLILLASILVLVGAGCASITNDEIIRETKKCEDAGLRAELHIGGLYLEPKRVICIPKDL